MSKAWACLLCGRSGAFGNSIEDAILEHRKIQIEEESTNRSMMARFHNFVGPATNCSGRIELAATKKPATAKTENLILGGSEPWI